MTTDEVYIKRCIQLAKNGLGTSYPNPLVGSVVVYNKKIVGEGWHYLAGKAHAEVNAIASVNDKTLLSEATIYVNLEPCSHFGKTPPCTNLIIESGIKKIVIGTIDPFDKVAGNGIKKLKEAGCEVSVGVLEKECQELNKRFFTFHKFKRPYIFLKWAQTADGFISPNFTPNQNRIPVWITNQLSKQLVHKQRSNEQAILIGTNTAVNDNPLLNTRLWKGNNPTRIVLDLNLRIPKKSNIFDLSQPTIIITSIGKKAINQTNLIYEFIDIRKPITKQIINVLYKHEIQSLIIEGGKQLLQSFIDANIWDEATIFTGTRILFKKGVKAPLIKGESKPCFLKKDTVTSFKNHTL